MSWEEAHRGVLKSSPRSFCEPLWLPGWSDRSIWGYDEPTGSYFAQLWPDGDCSDAPAIWIGALGGIVSRNRLVAEVATVTGHDVAAVETARRVEEAATNRPQVVGRCATLR